MIVLEGVDGSGKSVLARQLATQFDLPMHARASSSGRNGGPVDNLFEWAAHDVRTMLQQPLSVYDRHPMVSEYIYGPVVRRYLDPRFHATAFRRTFAAQALVIVCSPPLEAVRRAVSDERDMLGVTELIDTLYYLYASLTASWQYRSRIATYDYTRDKPADLFDRITNHIATWSYRAD